MLVKIYFYYLIKNTKIIYYKNQFELDKIKISSSRNDHKPFQI